MYGYEWTEEYGIYRLTVDAKLQKEIRPVFHEELDFFGMDAYWDYPRNTDAPLLWAEGVRRYVMNGVRVAETQGGGFYTRPTIQRFTEERLQLRPVDTKRLYEVNRVPMVSLEQKAIEFIRRQTVKYSQQGYSIICAFSGGKDSLVLLDLMAKALSPKEFYVVFSNTGMELSDTLKAVEKAKERWPQLRFEEAKSHMDPEESWAEFGPPGRRKRWCCSVHKSVPTILKLREITKDYNAKAVVFDGVRAEESARRAKYGEVCEQAKNASQINCHTMLYWNTAEIDCYLLYNELFLNDAYRFGLFRVGCKVCPMASEWWEGIANDVYREEVAPLIKFVERYASNAKGSEAKKFIENGGWKARTGGKGLDNGGNRVKESIDDNTLTFTIFQPRQNWFDVAPILGVFVDEVDKKDTFIHQIGGMKYKCHIYQKDEKRVSISYYPFNQMGRFTISYLRGVARKVAYCVGCKACEVQCPTGAFAILSDGKIQIREELCVHCYHCLTFSDRSCLLADNMRIPEGGLFDMKGLDSYHHFGLRATWIEYFFDQKLECFSQGILGTVQYSALKTWLKNARIIDSVKVEKANKFVITELGNKLMSFGAYNPFIWAIIWANLCYNSTICRWYCLNIEPDSNSEKEDLVVLLGDGFSRANRSNAVTALTETFRNSPIGSALKQGVPVPLTKNTYAYYREGWQYPNGVAVLYALYLYGEHTGLRSFTFSRLLGERRNPDAQGISPHDIFGIDSKTFRNVLQGLALSYPQYLRVQFKDNLDNIFLGEYSSLDILDLEKEE